VRKLAIERELYGRTVLRARSPEVLDAHSIGEILNVVMPIHYENQEDIEYCYNYYRGIQPILDRPKEIRDDINNKIVENRAFEAISFKVGYEFSHPLLYVSASAGTQNKLGILGKILAKIMPDKKDKNTEIINLNTYAYLDGKDAKDVELAEWFYKCGTSLKITLPNKEDSPDEAPYYTDVLDPRWAFIVYSTGHGRKPLFAGKYVVQEKVVDGEVQEKWVWGIFTDTHFYTWENDEKIEDFTDIKPTVEVHTHGMIPIVEYPANESRLGVIDVAHSLFNAINTLNSNRLDGIEQFIQSLLVFINCEIPTGTDGKKKLPKSGDAIDIRGVQGMQPSVSYLTSQLDQSEAQVTKEDLLDAFYEILSIPSRNDRSGGGDTGQAVLLRDGWGPAEASAKTTEKIFDRSENEYLKIVLHICRNAIRAQDEIGKLSLGDIRIQHTRNRNANMITKVTVLKTLLDCRVAPKIAYELCELFPDPLGAWEESKEWQENNPVEPIKETEKNEEPEAIPDATEPEAQTE
jgi:SPP1 family phage portal protein